MSSISNDARTVESLVRELERLRCVHCAGCGKPVCSHQALMAIAIGFKDSPRCLLCLGAALDRDPARLRGWLFDYIRQRACYLDAWNWANRAVGLPEGVMPPALQLLAASDASTAPVEDTLEIMPTLLRTDAEWDAGDMGCGDLVLELRLRLQAMQPAQIMKLCARDPGAPQDLPAWCRLTGHLLLHAEPPNYWIKRKE